MKNQTPDRPGSNRGKCPRLDGLCDMIFLLIYILTAQKPSECALLTFLPFFFCFPVVDLVCMELTACQTCAKRNQSPWSAMWSVSVLFLFHPYVRCTSSCLLFSWSAKQSLGWDCWRQTETNMNQTANLSLPPLLNLKYFPQLSWMHSLYLVRPW